MILFDSSVVIDLRDEQSAWHGWAKDQLSDAVAGEGAVINTVILAESSIKAIDREKAAHRIEEIGITLLPLPLSAAIPAAKAYALYLDKLKAEGKQPSSKIPLGDFFIGAHAEAEGMSLVTRDPARVKTYFPAVLLITPDSKQVST